MDKKAVIDIRVSTKSSKSGITIKDAMIKVFLNSPPVDGKANEECIAIFSKKTGVPKSSITIIKGHKSRNKTIQIAGITQDDLLSILDV